MEKKFLLQGLRVGWIVKTEKGGKYAFTDEDDLFGKFLKKKFVEFVEKALHTEEFGTKDFVISFAVKSSDSWQDIAKKKTKEIKGKDLNRGKDEPSSK